MTDETFDNFLDDATRAVADMWKSAGAPALSVVELYEISDWLTQFFADKKPADHPANQ
jgi:hypothetical protein